MSTKRTLEAFFQPATATHKKARKSTSPASNSHQTPAGSLSKTAVTNHSAPAAHPLSPTSTRSSSSKLDLALLTPSTLPASNHPTYPFPISQLPNALADALTTTVPGNDSKTINDAPDLDLLYFSPFIPRPAARALFLFLRSSLPFYRVKYSIRRGQTETQINTPRYTTVFGVDTTSTFPPDSSSSSSLSSLSSSSFPLSAPVDSKTLKPVPQSRYAACVTPPRPIPPALDLLRRLVEALAGGDEYNFVLVNYYADGRDSISYHSDDERFLGADPTIASLSLGATRDFLMRHKPLEGHANARKDATKGVAGNRGTVQRDEKQQQLEPADGLFTGGRGITGAELGEQRLTEREKAIVAAHANPLKLPMAGGDMVLMRGKSQSHWLHSIPKRSGKGLAGEVGRINITFRKALAPAGTANYYQYNVGKGPVMKWDEKKGEMVEWERDPNAVGNNGQRG